MTSAAAHSAIRASSSPISPATRRSILLLSCATFSSMVAQRICDAMLPELSRVFAVSLAQAAQVVSVFAVTYGISQLFYGPLGDRLGKFRIVTFAALGCSVGSAVAVFANSLDVLLLARIMMALGAAALIPLAMAWIGDTVPAHELQEMLTRTGLGSTLGIVCGQLLGGLLTDALGWRWAFAFLVLLFGAVGSLLWGDLRRQQALPKAEAEAQATPTPTPEASAAPMARPHFLKQTLLIISRPWPRTILLLAVIEGAMGFGVLAMWASHLHHALGLSLSAAGAIVALFGLGGVGYMAAGRSLIPRLGQHGLVLLGGGLLGISALAIAYIPHWGPAIPASLVGGFGFFMFHNVMQANATQMVPEARGTAVSLFASFLFLGQSLGVVLAAALIGRIGSSAVVALGGGVMAVEGAYFAWVLRRRGG
ncbi:MFS transporter [Polaromonas sp. JS666]|uniref:MFS transporter n=1 Tax=Polaromonas sp. (strain JS666 / ATCC BAA-500) TaxID=296591 RepID=UPI0008838B78|nr:MFS transporter [Polaromonas sp. JS666]SDM54963.1 Predicted arabinose efflux permease, MFS family [Polaromonas sp. JS666]